MRGKAEHRKISAKEEKQLAGVHGETRPGQGRGVEEGFRLYFNLVGLPLVERHLELLAGLIVWLGAEMMP